jgi:radical SAM superfamily enzyme YgiQ (UPF0313 family)
MAGAGLTCYGADRDVLGGCKRLSQRRFQLILVKPSHYDDEGYVIQWMMSAMPSNSLAVLYGLARDAEARQVLGRGVTVDIAAIDETNTRVKTDKIIRKIAQHGGLGLVGIIGVQSNQFPRALDIARPLRAAGVPVVIGGFHVSGIMAMLPKLTSELQAALDLGISLFAGEAETRFDELLRDAAGGALKPIYNFMKELPSIDSAPSPYLPRPTIHRTIGQWSTFDAGRGCPFQCSFCTIINVQGRKSRRRSPDDVEQIIRANQSQGINRFFITDDNFARNRDWESIFDRIIKLREQDRLDVRFMIQVDVLCHQIPNFIEKAARAGVQRVFIGIESINPDALLGVKKRQNRITEYRRMLLAWKAVGVITYAGYILGFPTDTPQSIKHDIEIIKRELPIDILEFYCLTPLPGSEDHKILWERNVWMDPDLNKFDSEHAVTAHPGMTREEWEQAYQNAWTDYYTPEHMETILRRAQAKGISLGRLTSLLVLCPQCQSLEGVHPMQGGVFRRKSRHSRRPGMPVEPIWSFYPTYIGDSAWKLWKIFRQFRTWGRLRRRIERDLTAPHYSDQALTPVSADESDEFEIFTHTMAARAAVKHIENIARLTHGEKLH